MGDAPISAEVATKLREQRALQILALLALLGLFWLARPVGVGLFLGTLLAFTLQPAYERLLKKKWTQGRAALVCTLTSLFVVLALIAALAILFITRGVALAKELPAMVETGGPWRNFAERTLTALHIDARGAFAHLEEQAMSLGTRAAAIATGVAAGTFEIFLVLFMMALATYFVLRNWTELVLSAELTLPFKPAHTRELLGQFRKAGSLVLRGTVVTGMVQGVLAGLGYWLAGLPSAGVFGALTAIASLVPAIGTLLIWVPAGIFLIVTRHAGAGIFLLAYGALVVAVVTDYLIRPRLVGGNSEESIPTVITFVSLFGGAELFGVIGLILGPTLATLCMAVLRTYRHEVLETKRAAKVKNAAKEPAP